MTPKIITGSKCKIYNNYDTLELNDQITYITHKWINVSYNDLNNNSDTISNHFLQLPKIINHEKLKQARLSLEDTRSMLEQIEFRKRTHNFLENSLSIFNYISYAALAALIIFVLNKIGILDCISKCFPRHLCLICFKNNVTATPQYNVTYSQNQVPLINTKRYTA